jgi:hypothetical protein
MNNGIRYKNFHFQFVQSSLLWHPLKASEFLKTKTGTMKRILLIAMLLPFVAMAQEVRPLINADYLSLIQGDTTKGMKTKDSSNSLARTSLRYIDYNYAGHYIIGKIKIQKGNIIKLDPAIRDVITISGSISSGSELQFVNRMPEVQNEYIQGRSVNGNLSWQGPETGELFSYGPQLQSLEFDGSIYPYDINGRLVPLANGNGKKPAGYNNSLFRTGSLIKNSVILQAKYKHRSQQVLLLILKAGQARGRSIISDNKNKADNFSASAEGTIKRIKITTQYAYQQERFTHYNRTGFLNRAYQNSLLTPVSFDNRQGTMIGALQRSYSSMADNPFFLFRKDKFSFLQQHHTAAISLERRIGKLRLTAGQSFEYLQQHNNEGYDAGTAFFPSGILINRATNDKNHQLYANAVYHFYSSYKFQGDISASYNYSGNKSSITYNTDAAYKYRRTSHDMAVSFMPQIRGDKTETGFVLTNKMYVSTTARVNDLFLPALSGYIRFHNLFDLNNLTVRVFGSYSEFNSELPIDKSYAYTGLLQHAVANNLEYLPVTEAEGFANLDPIRHQEFSLGAEVDWRNKISASFNWYTRNTADDIFPILNGDQLHFQNIATHRNRGFETDITFYPSVWGGGKLDITNTISFSTYRSKVTDVKSGYDYTPVAGFSNVHKTIVKGEPLGIIMGNTWLRDAAGNRVIGSDGFPITNNTKQIIGNSIPDFTLKATQRINYKKLELSFDIEWEKGGDRWNGTEAVLDYYGRSAGTGVLRSTTNYVFDGVQANGARNNIPVDFYSQSAPLSQNRWVRYGHAGVAEDYIQRADVIRLRNIGISYKQLFKKHLQQLVFTVYANNIIVWSPYKGVDTNQLLNDQPGTDGLDFFNLPSFRSFGFNLSLQF